MQNKNKGGAANNSELKLQESDATGRLLCCHLLAEAEALPLSQAPYRRLSPVMT